MAAVFPDQIACAENLVRSPVKCPTIRWSTQTVHDCLHEAMDIEGLERLLARHRVGRRSRSSRAT